MNVESKPQRLARRKLAESEPEPQFFPRNMLGSHAYNLPGFTVPVGLRVPRRDAAKGNTITR